MRGVATLEPPEYRDWICDPAVLAAFRATLTRDPRRRAWLERLEPGSYLDMYRGLLRSRLLDLQLRRWVMQGVISKAWLGLGEEAVTVGTVQALRPGDVVGPMIRNQAACTEMGMPMAQVLRAYLGTADGPTGGRDFHHGDPDRGVIAPISHVGALVPVLAGAALAFQLQGRPHVALTYAGDGTTRTGEFHEGLGLAAARRAPLVLVVQQNGIALGTRTEEHTRGRFEDLPAAYGIAGLVCDGNNVLDVRAAAAEAVDRARGGDGPIVLVAHTFRMGGHATHDEQAWRQLFSDEERQYWGARDPCRVYEQYLLEEQVPGISASTLAAIEEEVAHEVEAAVAEALRSGEHARGGGGKVSGGVLAAP